MKLWARRGHKLFLQPYVLLTYRTQCFMCSHHVADWNSNTVRSTFINYFTNQGHINVPSSSVIPKKGEGTYFTNAGMNQFKPVILGELHPDSKFKNLVRAVNSQKCIRVGGKHNDLEDVGHDLTHHTFFEMLGNWSFGDYFKTKACHMAYELLVNHYQVPPERLYFTYFAGDATLNLPSDEECRRVWLSLGIPESKILPFGVKDNFWDMGLTGPCGPCTEIHFDHVGERDAECEVNTGSPNVVEIWNLVFMQYNRQKDQSLKKLKHFHVDTGMGLERMTAVLNGTADNYRTDLFMQIFEVIQKFSGKSPYGGSNTSIDTSYRILADHTRMFTVAISDGLLPSNSNLGHKLRTIIHRCINITRKVFQTKAEVLLPALVSVVVQSLGAAYPELYKNEQWVCDIVQSAIEHHDRQQNQGIHVFNKVLSRLNNSNELSAEVIAVLEKGTYGTPMSVELICELAKEKGVRLDMQGYQALVQQSKINASMEPIVSSPDISSFLIHDLISQQVPQTNDIFKYNYTSVNDSAYDFDFMCKEMFPSKVQGLSCNGEIVSKLEEGDHGQVVLDKTCFYAESGGQEADTGRLVTETGEFYVTDVKHHRGYIVHYGHMTSGSLLIGHTVTPMISQATRLECMHNHTATHLLNSALSKIAPSCHQQGSSISPYKFTFDFHSLTLVDKSQVKAVQDDVREAIRKELFVSREIMPLNQALNLQDIKKLRNEEYPDEVSVVTIASPDRGLVYSRELCAGTHVVNTSHIKDFCITHMTTKSQNVKRMTCVSGDAAKQAHYLGDILQSTSLVLQSLVENKSMPSKHLDSLKSLILKTLQHIESTSEKLQHKIIYSWEDKVRLEDIDEENNKAQVLCKDINVTINQLEKGTGVQEDIMKQLTALIKQARYLELLPKSVRDDMHACLESCEHKVAEIVNRRNTLLLNKMLEEQIKVSRETSPLMLQIDHLDISPRHVARALTRQAWPQSIIIIQKSSDKTVHVLFSLPLTTFKLFTNEEFAKILQLLGCFGATKGKLATQKEDSVAVYTFSIETEVASKVVEQKLRDEKLLYR